MTDQERARALSGATRECRTLYNALTGPDCPDCQGTGRVPLLDLKRARKPCPGCPECKLAAWVILGPYVSCHGDGWLSTLREEPEPCREPIPEGVVWGVSAEREGLHPSHPPTHRCGGSGLVQAWRLQLLIELLEEAGCDPEYRSWPPSLPILKKVQWRVHDPKTGRGYRHPVLAVAACEALNLKPEVKSEPADPK